MNQPGGALRLETAVPTRQCTDKVLVLTVSLVAAEPAAVTQAGIQGFATLWL